MSSFALIHPRDDLVTRQASDWGSSVASDFVTSGHTQMATVDDSSPADNPHVVRALGSAGTLICYFGHGDKHSWLTSGVIAATASEFAAAAKKAVVSIACKTGCNLGGDAVTSGVEAWLGFTVNVAVIAPYKGLDPIGDAVVAGLSVLGAGKTMQESRDELYALLDAVVTNYDTGKFSTHPNANFKYWAAVAIRDHIVLHGTTGFAPL